MIKSIVFNKGDYAYHIESFDGKKVTKLSTNDEPEASLLVAKKDLSDALKDWLHLPEEMHIYLNSVRFSKDVLKPSSAQFTATMGIIRMGIVTKILPCKDSEKADSDLVVLNDSLSRLQEETVKYFRGERAQKELFKDGLQNTKSTTSGCAN